MWTEKFIINAFIMYAKSELIHLKLSKVCHNLLSSLKGSTAGMFEHMHKLAINYSKMY